MGKYRLVVTVSGSGSNLQVLIDQIEAGNLDAEIVGVISSRPGVLALERAERHGIPTHVLRLREFPVRTDFDHALCELLKSLQPDLIVEAGYMVLLGQEVLDSFTNRIINLHPALCPLFPGMHGIEEALEYGVKVTGCTVFIVDGGCDTGPIVGQRAIAVKDDDTAESLGPRVHAEEHVLLPQVVRAFAQGRVKVEGRKVLVQGGLY